MLQFLNMIPFSFVLVFFEGEGGACFLIFCCFLGGGDACINRAGAGWFHIPNFS